MYFITLELRFFYTLYIIAALIYNYRGGDISFLLKQCYGHSLIPTYYTLKVSCLDLLECFKECFKGAFLGFFYSPNTRTICYG